MSCCCVSLCDENNQPLANVCPHSATYSYGPVGQNVPQDQEIIASRQTITVPLALSLPVLVRFCGSADDGIALDGVRISLFAETPANQIVASRTFTIGTWNDRGPAVARLGMCFFEYNPLP